MKSVSKVHTELFVIRCRNHNVHIAFLIAITPVLTLTHEQGAAALSAYLH